MLRFDPVSSTSDIWQLIDLSDHQGIVAAGKAEVSASALFNRINAGDPSFRVLITAYDGSMSTWPEDAGNYTDYAITTIQSDSDLTTWQLAHAGLMLPEDTTYIGIKVRAFGGYQGHYVDDVVVTIVPEPATLGVLGLGGLVLLKRRRGR